MSGKRVNRSGKKDCWRVLWEWMWCEHSPPSPPKQSFIQLESIFPPIFTPIYLSSNLGFGVTTHGKPHIQWIPVENLRQILILFAANLWVNRKPFKIKKSLKREKKKEKEKGCGFKLRLI